MVGHDVEDEAQVARVAGLSQRGQRRVAAQVLLKTNASLTNLRGTMHDYHGIKLMVTYHPAALLRNPNWKRPTWEDVQKLRKEYDSMKK